MPAGPVPRTRPRGRQRPGACPMCSQRCLAAERVGLSVGPAVRIADAATPHEVPGWDQLASGRCFYVTADWLRYADTDRVARSRYLGLSIGGRLAAALSSHSAPDEVDADYVAARTLEFPSGTPSVDNDVLTLGGRRGFLSGVLVARDTRPRCRRGTSRRAHPPRNEYRVCAGRRVVVAVPRLIGGRRRPGSGTPARRYGTPRRPSRRRGLRHRRRRHDRR